MGSEPTEKKQTIFERDVMKRKINMADGLDTVKTALQQMEHQ